MSFSARLESDLVSVEAGATVPVSLEVVNSGDALDRFEVEIEGLDPEWTAVPVPVFAIKPGEKSTEKIFFKPPRASESLAGNYPFVVKVRSLETGEANTVQGALQIKPFHHLSIELNPKRGTVSPWKSNNDFHVTVMNLGNTEHTLQLYGNDPDEALAFEFENEQVTVGPGQQKTIEVYVDPTSKRMFASSRLYMFTISARSVSQPSIVSSSQAQLEQRPLVSPATMVALALVLSIAALWWYLLPKPPSFDSLRADRQSVLVGESVRISWKASNANGVKLYESGKLIYEGATTDSYQFTKSDAGIFNLEAVAYSESKQAKRAIAVTVTLKPTAPHPEIVEFKVNPRTVKLGEPFVITYRVSPSVTRLMLQPLQEPLDLTLNEKELQATQVGAKVYTLVAYNADNQQVQKQVTVTVIDPTKPGIIEFKATPATVAEGGEPVTLSWHLVNTVRATISIQGGESFDASVPTGSREVIIGDTTKITITGVDAQGRPVTKTITVTKKAPDPEPPPATTGDQTTGGTATTGGTTGGTTTTGTTGGPR
jgi:hypothetical protein